MCVKKPPPPVRWGRAHSLALFRDTAISVSSPDIIQCFPYDHLILAANHNISTVCHTLIFHFWSCVPPSCYCSLCFPTHIEVINHPPPKKNFPQSVPVVQIFVEWGWKNQMTKTYIHHLASSPICIISNWKLPFSLFCLYTHFTMPLLFCSWTSSAGIPSISTSSMLPDPLFPHRVTFLTQSSWMHIHPPRAHLTSHALPFPVVSFPPSSTPSL